MISHGCRCQLFSSYFQTMLELMNVDVVMPRFCSILMEMSSPRELTHYKTGFWGRAQVIFLLFFFFLQLY